MDLSLRETLESPDVIRWWRYQLPSGLEQRFADETRAERNRQIRFWVGVWFGFSWFTFVLDLLTVPSLWPLSLGTRLLLITPIGIWSFWQLGRPAPRWRITLASISLPASSLLCVILLFVIVPQTDLFVPANVLTLGVLWTIVLIPLRFRDAVPYTALVLLGGGLMVGIAAALRHAPVHHPDVISVGLVMDMLALLSRYTGEQAQRRSFLSGLRLQLRNEELARSNDSLREMSNTDPLTGLANRRFFDLTFVQCWRRAAQAAAPLAVLMIDVDRFKLFNDTAGHLEGDRCLATLARTIAGHIRIGHDLAARFGGEEFIVLMPATDEDKAFEIASRIHTAIAALKVFHPGRMGANFVSVSIGVAACIPVADAPAGLLAAADSALYAAKKAGRDRVIRAKLAVV